MHPVWLRCSSLTYRRVCSLLTPCQPGASTPKIWELILAPALSLLTSGVLVAALCSPCAAAFRDADQGTSAGQFLKLGAGARALGMGEAQAAVAEGAGALYWNPAALTLQKESNSVLLQHAEYIESFIYNYGAYSRRVGDYVTAASLMYLSVDSIAHTDVQGTRVGSFKPHDWAFTAGGARALKDRGSVGLAYKRVSSTIMRSDSTNAFDMGVLSPPLLGGKNRLGLSIHNLGGKFRFREESNPLPVLIRVGSAYHWSKAWLWALDVQLYRDNSPNLALGTERWTKIEKFEFALRAGFNTRTTDAAGFAGVSFGVGMRRDYSRGGERLGVFQLDYALVPLGDLGLTHQVSIGADF